MTDYTKTTDFAAKDSLPSGDSGKIIRGAEFETEFDNISTSIATKADLASPTFTGTATIPTAAVTSLTLGGVAVTSTATELNLLDGITNIFDEDDMSSDSANGLATQQSIKAYVDTAVAAKELVEDTTPQLGGNLDLNSNNITGTGDIDISGTFTIDEIKTSAYDSILTVRDDSDPNVEGELVKFLRNNGSGGYTTVGRLGYLTVGSDLDTTFFITGLGNGLGFYNFMTYYSIVPVNNIGNHLDNLADLGRSSARFDDIYATNSTIQTSDVNEKQDINVLSDAEQRVAVAAKGLLKKFRWKSAVEEKGDDARIHFGIIAQDLQAAFQTEGLDAGRYGMFVSDTWTDSETGEEKSRMGVRYSELLAFIISAI